MIQFAENLFRKYEIFKEKSLTKRRIKHKDIKKLISELKNSKGFEQKLLGHSHEGREIFLIKLGGGKTKIMFWSQMHGDESTATQALFDIFNFFKDNEHFTTEKENILNKLSLYFIPMLNPDGAEKYKRRNAIDVDLNRDAARLITLEANIIKNLRDDIKPDFGFNLHDQNPYYTVGNTNKPTTISFLAPVYNQQKDINEVRIKSMQLVVLMNKVLQNYIPGQVGSYYDNFGPSSIGDNMQKWGTSTILIESGAQYNDPERQFVRKLNFISLLTGMKIIANQSYKNENYREYFNLSENNDGKMFHLLIRNAILKVRNIKYKIDIGIILNEIDNEDHTDFILQSEIKDIGDLRHYYAYREINADGAEIRCNNSNQECILKLESPANFQLYKDEKMLINIKNGIPEIAN